MYKKTILASLLFSISLSTQTTAQTSTGIEEILVTADFRQQALSDIASSVSIIDNDEINRSHSQHLEELILSTPNVNFAGGSSRARFFQIRGIGERGQFSEPLNPSVGLMIDGVDFSGAGNAALLFDVEQVEVLMGPQGTRYGSNALAGLINIQSKAPSETTAFGIKLDAANYDTRGIAGYATGAISDKLLYRISAQSSKSDGINHNATLNRSTNQRDESLIRTKLSWQASDTVELDLSFSVIDLDNGYDAFSLDNTRTTLSDQPGEDSQKSEMLSAKLMIDSFESVGVEIITAYANSDIVYGYDEDWSFVGLHPDEYSATDYYYRDKENLSAELRFLSKPESLLFNDSTSWVAGLYSLQQEVSLRRDYTYLANDFTSSYEIDRLAAFAETDTAFNERWSLTLGLRLEQFDARYQDSSLLSFVPEETLVGGKIALSYRTENDSLIYLNASRGYKAGGFNTDGTLDADLREFDSEKLWNYELGYKAEHFDGQLQSQIALFYMDRSAVQIASSTTRVRPDSSTEFIDYIGNAANGNNYGLELNSKWTPQNNLHFYTTLGLLRTEYQNFINSGGANFSGREQAHAPSYQYKLGAIFKLNQDLSFNFNIEGKDRFFFSDSHDIQSSKYNLANASMDWDYQKWQFSLWGRNLSNEDYSVRGFFFGNDPRDGYTSKGYIQFGEPRRFGITLSADF